MNISAIGYSPFPIGGARVQGPRGRPSEGPGGRPPRAPQRGPAHEAGPAPGPAPSIGNGEQPVGNMLIPIEYAS